MRTRIGTIPRLAAMLAVAGSLVPEALAQVVDQESPPGGASGSTISIASPVGQEFVPTFEALGAIDVDLATPNPGDVDLGLEVEVRLDTITGDVVATSGVVFPSATIGAGAGLVRFALLQPVNLVRGQRYVVKVIASNSRSGVRSDQNNPYAAGRGIFNGTPSEIFDTGFRSLVNEACDPDLDTESMCNGAVDNCPFEANADQDDADGDTLGDACDPTDDADLDGDTVANEADNCPFEANDDQGDADDDGVGDACDQRDDSDVDGDGTANEVDLCPFDPDPDCDDGDGGCGCRASGRAGAAGPLLVLIVGAALRRRRRSIQSRT